jgi:hypothetical protein
VTNQLLEAVLSYAKRGWLVLPLLTVRAKKHSKAKLSEWGKKGGRPKKKAEKE